MKVNVTNTFVVYDPRDLAILETHDSMTRAFEARRDYPHALVAGRWAYSAMVQQRMVGA